MAGMAQLLAAALIAWAIPATAWALVMLAFIRRIPVAEIRSQEGNGTAAPQKVVGKARSDRSAIRKQFPQ